MSVFATKHKGVIQSFAGNGTFCVGGWQYYEANLPTGEVDANGTAIYAIFDIPQSTVMYAVDDAGSGCEIKMTPASYNLSSANATLSNVTVWSANSILTRDYADARYAPVSALIDGGTALSTSTGSFDGGSAIAN